MTGGRRRGVRTERSRTQQTEGISNNSLMKRGTGSMVDSKVLERIYGDKASQAEGRYESLEKNFREKFGESVPEFFSAPGRTEIIGNHTDHNGGRILAASIEMDTIAAAARTDSPVVTIISEGYRDPIVVDTSALDKVPLCKGSVSLVAGILAGALKFGYQIGGFNAYPTTCEPQLFSI